MCREYDLCLRRKWKNKAGLTVALTIIFTGHLFNLVIG